jgi:hypothetical protein
MYFSIACFVIAAIALSTTIGAWAYISDLVLWKRLAVSGISGALIMTSLVAGILWVNGRHGLAIEDENKALRFSAHIAARLVIDSWFTGMDPTVHIGIENIGELQIDQITGGYSNPEVNEAELDPSVFPRTLPPRGKLSIPVAPLNGLNKYRTLSFNLSYTTVAQRGDRNHFSSRYRFLIPQTIVLPSGQSIDPEQWEEITGEVKNKDSIQAAIEQFARPQGTIFLVIPEIGPDKQSPNVVSIGNNYRQFVFDTRFRTVTFKSRLLPARQGTFTPAGVHIVVLSWDDHMAQADLRIDRHKITQHD